MLRRMSRVLLPVAAAALLLAGCGSDGPPADGADTAGGLLADHGLDGLDGREVVEALESMPVAERPTDLMASVQSDAVVLTDDRGREESVDLPEDAFYVSVAPYAEQTHDCYLHSLTTCRGELADVEVQVTVTDADDGSTVLDEARRTESNGFVGLWLPRDRDLVLTITRDGERARSTISTGADDPTCLTTLKLA